MSLYVLNHWKLWEQHEIWWDLRQIRDEPWKLLQLKENTSKQSNMENVLMIWWIDLHIKNNYGR